MTLNISLQVTAQYNLENADSEAEFTSLQNQLATVTATAREQEVTVFIICRLQCWVVNIVETASDPFVSSCRWS